MTRAFGCGARNAVEPTVVRSSVGPPTKLPHNGGRAHSQFFFSLTIYKPRTVHAERTLAIKDAEIAEHTRHANQPDDGVEAPAAVQTTKTAGVRRRRLDAGASNIVTQLVSRGTAVFRQSAEPALAFSGDHVDVINVTNSQSRLPPFAGGSARAPGLLRSCQREALPLIFLFAVCCPSAFRSASNKQVSPIGRFQARRARTATALLPLRRKRQIAIGLQTGNFRR